MPAYNSQLELLLQNGALRGTWLLLGPDNEEKGRLCLELAKSLLGPSSSEKMDKGNHPDFHSLYPESKSGLHAITAIRELIDTMSLPPYEGPCKVFVIHDAERMLPTGSNALLKTLEEPHPDAVLILLSRETRDLLPTIVSRCRIIRCSMATSIQIHPQIVSLLSEERDHPALLKYLDEMEATLEEGEESSQRLKQLDSVYEQILYWYRDLHLLNAGGSEEYLCHRDYRSALEKVRARTPLPPLDKVFTLIRQCRLASERYTRLRSTLEWFVLELYC